MSHVDIALEREEVRTFHHLSCRDSVDSGWKLLSFCALEGGEKLALVRERMKRARDEAGRS